MKFSTPHNNALRPYSQISESNAIGILLRNDILVIYLHAQSRYNSKVIFTANNGAREGSVYNHVSLSFCQSLEGRFPYVSSPRHPQDIFKLVP